MPGMRCGRHMHIMKVIVANHVIESIRSMFTRGGQEKAALDGNELIRGVLALLHSAIQRQRVSVHTDLIEQLTRVLGNRV